MQSPFQKRFVGSAVRWFLVSLSVTLAGAGSGSAAPAWEGEKIDTWRGFRRHVFTVDGCQAWVAEPKQPAPGNPWTWCMEFPDAFTERTGVPQLLEKGFFNVHIVVGNTHGCPAALKHFDVFYQAITSQGLAKKGTLIGISRGGLYAYNWAAQNPDKVVSIYGDAPVCDFKSWPGGKGKGKGSAGDWAALIKNYGFKDEAEALAYKLNPVDNLAPLAKAGIPLIHVVGDADDVVPVAENTAIIEERYKALGGAMTVIHKPGVGHHPHGLDDSAPVVKSILAWTGKALGWPTVGLRFDSPLNWQVVQRHSLREGVIPVQGSCDVDCDHIEARVVGESLKADWVKAELDPATASFSVKLTAPAGGWYVVEVRATKNGNAVATAKIEHVGVGEVFVGAGQSNSTSCGGLGSHSPLDGRTQPVSGLVTTFDGKQWRIANDPQPGAHDEKQYTYGSFWPAFGDAMAARFKVPIGVAVTGHGGTAIAQWKKGGELFNWTLGRMRQLGTGGFRAVLWHQGESDKDMPAQTYADGLGQIIRDFRGAAGWDMPWFVANASYHPNQPLNEAGSRGGQKLLWQQGVALEGPDTDVMTGDLRDQDGKGIHFSKKGLKAHGEAWAEKVGTWLDKESRKP